MLGKVQTPKTKQDLVKSIQSIPRMDFSVIEMGTQRDKQSVISSLDRMVSKGPVSVILIQEK
jgi:hypothetical protein